MDSANVTISCVVNGLQLSLVSPSVHLNDCESLLRYANISINERSVTDIIWSCLATIFACPWVSVHPNIPHPDATEWQIRRQRFLLMICGLIAPELIVLWALRQWIGARSLVRKMEEKSVLGFTSAHGHFLQMGGFMLYSDETRIGVIEDGNELVSCLQWPRGSKFLLPTTAQIHDKSKGDGLSKGLVVVQAGWFIMQCISRWATGLAITEAELVTLALAALNGIIYFLWWHKPLDVRYAIPVIHHALDFDRLNHTSTFQSWFSSSSRCLPSFTPPLVSAISCHSVEWKPRLADDLQDIGQLFASSAIGRLFYRLKAEPQRTQGNSLDIRKPLQISLLHTNCNPEDTFGATAVASAIAILFGAIHCVGWNFIFRTPQERTLWQIWSIIITAAPLFLFARSIVWYLFIRRLSRVDHVAQLLGRKSVLLLKIAKHIKGPGVWVTTTLVPVYVIARCGLVLQALVALRDLQVAERAPVNWVNLLPHV
ncbi:hypothetical protein D9619_004211 [Psilocybe cf. subviscida]|uniref:Uncharacterized protein n=1 Tax=Psilocybe cf. subviscida TaxID=2480587 RepID=A0A8H5F7Q2_9AGAR|nr:hypothetical protein D9619_004211 [Psilocybe cf. subviscida]